MSLVYDWPLFSDLEDDGANDRHLALIASGQQVGQFVTDADKGKVYELTGGAYLEAGPTIATSPCSFTMWIKTAEFARDFWGVGNDPAQSHMLLRTRADPGAVRLGAHDGAGNTNLDGALAVADDAWHHVAAVFLGASDRRLYIDGASDGQSVVTRTLSVSPSTMRIGRGPEGTTLDLRVFGARFYNHGLSAVEVMTALQESDRSPPKQRRAGIDRGVDTGIERAT